MIRPGFLLDTLLDAGIKFCTGVPDSLMKNFLLHLDSSSDRLVHVPAANEGGAIGLATGHYLSTRRCPLVYMQNSGLGNAANPLLSLADRDVYSIPMLLLIGWRGEPGVPDEPQHIKQGRITLDLLKAMEIPFEGLPAEESGAGAAVRRAYETAVETSAPSALVLRKSILEKTATPPKPAPAYPMYREEALKIVLGSIEENAAVVSTTGKLSRELYEFRAAASGQHADFLTVGSMGHVSQIALGVALGSPDRPVYCLDGDGSVIMHLGGLTVAGTSGLTNFKHIVFNNGAHDSVGGQNSRGFDVDLLPVATAAGYKSVFYADNDPGLQKETESLKNTPGPAMLEIRVKPGARKDLGRPADTPADTKSNFMNRLQIR
jgi:phosphonopyruvate decarboxylase